MEASLQPPAFFGGPEDPLQIKLQIELDLITAADRSEVLAEQSDENMEEIYEVLASGHKR